MEFMGLALLGWDGIAVLNVNVELEVDERYCGCGLFTRIQPEVLVFVKT